MAAAISAGNVFSANNHSAKILLLEKNPQPGKKLLVTGHNRCNITNIACEDYEEVLKFFSQIGFLLRLEKGTLYYPASGQAATVRDALWESLCRMGGDLRLYSTAEDVQVREEGFEVCTASGEVFIAEELILATGGKAGPQFGCTGDGYSIAKALGHSLVSPLPALVQLVCDEQAAKGRLAALKGVRAKGAASFYSRGRLLETSVGEIQFSENGLSGICIFDLSRHMREKDKDTCIILDLAPDYSKDEIKRLLSERLPAGLSGILPVKLARLVEDEANSDPGRCAALIKEMVFHITGSKGWKEAQITSGGVALDEIAPETLESKFTPGFYMCGEILDYDGRCGGFNLNWAWNTGIKAGRAAARAILAKAGVCRE